MADGKIELQAGLRRGISQFAPPNTRASSDRNIPEDCRVSTALPANRRQNLRR